MKVKVIKFTPIIVNRLVYEYTVAAIEGRVDKIKQIQRRARYLAYNDKLDYKTGLQLDDLMASCKRWLEARSPTLRGA